MQTKRIVWLTISLAALLVVVLVLGRGRLMGSQTTPVATSTWTVVNVGDMVLVPSGTFAMGNCMEPVQPSLIARAAWLLTMTPKPSVLDNDPAELPVHTVMVSAFYMDKHEVTKEKWDEIYNWAVAHGYSLDHPGKGNAPDHPVHSVSWYDCVKWCNARSEMEGLTPCYYTDAVQTQIYRIGQISLSNEYVNWTTNGYRLPTEAEWEKAARGGISGCRFPWGNTISHDQANYGSSPLIRYDISRTWGCHPKFAQGGFPYTSPVGSFDPNGYGLYDMAGNVFEWCWDWYDKSYYTGSPGRDPRGPSSSKLRVLRGGTWVISSYGVRCALRAHGEPGNVYYYFGFRCVKGL